MDADLKRDLVCKTILSQIQNGCTHYTNIKDNTTAKCKKFVSSNTITRRFYNYLIPQGYIERMKPGKYSLTQKGEKLLVVLNQIST